MCKKGYRDVDFQFVPSCRVEGDNGEETTLFALNFEWSEDDDHEEKNNNSSALLLSGTNGLIQSMWDPTKDGEVNSVVADSLYELSKTFRASKKNTKNEYPKCDFCQVDYDKVLKKAVKATRKLPIRIDFLNERGCMVLIPGVGSATLRRINLILGSPIGEMEWKCTWSNLSGSKHTDKKTLINIDIEWVESDESNTM
jgi:hypothetical protein